MIKEADLASLRDEATHQLTSFNPNTRSKTIPLRRGQAVVIGDIRGTGRIVNLWLTFPGWFWQHWAPEAPVSASILKTVILRIYWDGASKPAVESPVGDFFGVGLCETANFAGRYFGMSSGGFYCKFPMPFRTGFRIEVENRDAIIDTDVFLNALYQLDPALPANSAYFHAQFHTGHNEGPAPIPIAEAHGRGHFAGCTLSMQGMHRNYLSFLEAPEHMYIDDDWDTPRVIGTGLEDYFLGGWYFRDGTFAGPLHGVPVKDALNASVAMYRVHAEDAIHFQNRFRMAFVTPWPADRLKPFRYSSTAFLYLDKPEGQGAPVPARDALMCWYRIRPADHQSIP